MFIFYTEQQTKEAIRMHPHLANEMKLTGQALEVFYCISIKNTEGLTAAKVSDIYGFSVQHSNQVLKSLIKKGYIKRTESPQKSGGYEFIYTVI